MYKVSISKSGKPLDMNKIFNSSNMYKIGKIVLSLMVKRTKSGKDYTLKLFIPYAKSNRNKYGKTVDLTQSGHMLNSISIKAYVKKVNIFLNNAWAIKKAMWNAEHKNYIRKWWGISDPITQKIDTFIKDLFKRTYK